MFGSTSYHIEKMNNAEGLEALFEYATEGILVTNSAGDIIRVNPATERLFGYEKGELIGKQVEMLVPMKHRGAHVANREKYYGGPHPRSMGIGLDLKGKRKDNSEFPLEISLSPFTSGGETFVIAFIVDITLRKIAEDKLKNYSIELEKQVEDRTMILREAISELEKTKEELHEALQNEKKLNDLKSRFVSLVSHEFRTPLAGILSSLSLVRKYGELNEPEKQVKHIARIKEAVNSLTDILNDMLSISKLEEGKVVANPEPVNFKEFAADIISDLQALAKADQKIAYTHSGIEELLIDKKIKRHILFNLVSNAIKFSPEGAIIHVTSVADDDGLTLTVKDEGIGISPEDQVHLFERFFRGHNVTNIQGTGLGLNIVLKYVEMLNGTINVHSELNKGTTFIIKFPKHTGYEQENTAD